jgi:hypothetical protein
MVTLWALWHARRNIVHEGNYHSPLLTHCFIERFIGDLKQLDHTPVSNLVVLPRGPRWIAPPQGLGKINVDFALSKTSPKGAIAAVARSSEGSFLGASSLVINGLMDPDEGMIDGPPTFAYLVFGPGRVSLERLSRPIKVMAWRGPGAILGAQARFRGVQVRLVIGRSDLYLA